MRTRVVRYWHKTDWLYKVEKWVECTGDERWFSPIEGMRNIEVPALPGQWYWAFEAGELSRDRATSIASRLAENLPQEDADVIAEFGNA